MFHIGEIDQNLKVEANIKRDGLVWLDAREAPFRLFGLHDAENKSVPFHRIPFDVAEATSTGVRNLNFHTAGGRVRFSTDSPYIAIRAELQSGLCGMNHMPLTGTQGFDLYRDEDDGGHYVKTFVPPLNFSLSAFDSVIDLAEGGVRDYTINFPLYGICKTLYIGLKAGSSVGSGRDYRNDKPVIFYGSSITQGGCSSRPGTCYEAHFSQKNNLDYRNLGWSGNARGEEPIVRYMASLPMAAFVSDYDHNAPSPEHLLATHFRLYEAIREQHPDIPYLMISAPTFRLNDTFKRRRDIVRDSYLRARDERGDKNVYYIDGSTFFEGDRAEDCTVDGTHPTDLGFYRMYRKIDAVLTPLLLS